MTSKPIVPRRSVIAWSMYDWANSAFTTSIQTVIFSVYFVQVLVPPGGETVYGLHINGASLWSYLNSAVMFVVLLLSPPLGALADECAGKRVSLITTVVIGSCATVGLFWALPGHLLYSVGMAFLALIGYELSLVFYNAFLNDVSDSSTVGAVSGLGFALGYIGGGLCLGLNMIMIARPAMFGLGGASATLPARAGFFVVGIWWLIFSLPIFLWVKDKPLSASRNKTDLKGGRLFSATVKQLMDSTRRVWREKDLRRFILAFLFYNDGIQTILLLAAVFGAQALHMSTKELGLCYLLIQFVAYGGAMACGRWADSWGHKKIVLSTLVVYAMVTIWAIFMQTKIEFWILGVVIGLILGGSQAASRSLFSLFVPPDRTGEYYAFFSVVGKASAFMGPLLFGVINQVYGLRAGVASLLFFFLLGGTLLIFVKDPSLQSAPAS